MVTVKLNKADRAFFERFGQRLRKIILEERGYSSLDAFSIEHHDKITKATLYAICDGKRDMKWSTMLRLAAALRIPLEDLIKTS